MNDSEPFVHPMTSGWVARQVLNSVVVEPAQVWHRHHRPRFGVVALPEPEGCCGVVQQEVRQAFFVVAGEPHDATVGADGVTQLGCKHGEPVDRRLCGAGVGRREPVLAELGEVGVVAHQHDKRWARLPADSERYGDRCLVVGRLEQVAVRPVVADLHVGQHHAALPAVNDLGAHLRRRHLDRSSRLHDRPRWALGPLRRKGDAGQVNLVGLAVSVLVEALVDADLLHLADVVDVDAVALEQVGDPAELGRCRLLGCDGVAEVTHRRKPCDDAVAHCRNRRRARASAGSWRSPCSLSPGYAGLRAGRNDRRR